MSKGWWGVLDALLRAGVRERSKQDLRDALAEKTTLNERQIEEVVRTHNARDRARLLVDLHRRQEGESGRRDGWWERHAPPVPAQLVSGVVRFADPPEQSDDAATETPSTEEEDE